jgi:hypothetical protein
MAIEGPGATISKNCANLLVVIYPRSLKPADDCSINLIPSRAVSCVKFLSFGIHPELRIGKHRKKPRLLRLGGGRQQYRQQRVHQKQAAHINYLPLRIHGQGSDSFMCHNARHRRSDGGELEVPPVMAELPFDPRTTYRTVKQLELQAPGQLQDSSRSL